MMIELSRIELATLLIALEAREEKFRAMYEGLQTDISREVWTEEMGDMNDLWLKLDGARLEAAAAFCNNSPA